MKTKKIKPAKGMPQMAMGGKMEKPLPMPKPPKMVKKGKRGG